MYLAFNWLFTWLIFCAESIHGTLFLQLFHLGNLEMMKILQILCIESKGNTLSIQAICWTVYLIVFNKMTTLLFQMACMLLEQVLQRQHRSKYWQPSCASVHLILKPYLHCRYHFSITCPVRLVAFFDCTIKPLASIRHGWNRTRGLRSEVHITPFTLPTKFQFLYHWNTTSWPTSDGTSNIATDTAQTLWDLIWRQMIILIISAWPTNQNGELRFHFLAKYALIFAHFRQGKIQ